MDTLAEFYTGICNCVIECLSSASRPPYAAETLQCQANLSRHFFHFNGLAIQHCGILMREVAVRLEDYLTFSKLALPHIHPDITRLLH